MFFDALQPKTQPTFAKFPVDRLIDNTVTDFDMFLVVDRHLILYGGQGYRWEKSELDRLIGMGYQHFLVRPEELNKASVYEKMARLPTISKEQAPAQRIVSIQEIGAAFTRYLYEGELTESCVHKAQTLATGVVECIMDDPSCVQAITGLADHDQYTYLHSIRVSAYATAIAAAMGLTDQEKLRAIALGGIFHDVGKTLVPLTVINKAGPLLETEWSQMRSHPLFGIEKVQETVLEHVPREIILHHHEKLNGSGYPHALEKGSILTEVQIASVADIFDALTSSRSYQAKRTRYEALDFMKHKFLKTDIDPEVFRGLVACLVNGNAQKI